jgi:AraC-like DNA-binding protein/mannose-6-phosphate isomerase-like protein (cupin superfamily)
MTTPKPRFFCYNNHRIRYLQSRTKAVNAMAALFRHEFHDPSGHLYIEHIKRRGHFSMTANHFHNYYELYYLCEGDRMYFIRDRAYRVRAGDLVFIDRHVLHKTSDTGMPDHERIIVNVYPEWIEAAYSDHADLLLAPFRSEFPILTLPPQQLAAVRRIISEMSGEMQRQEPGCSISLRHAVIQLLLLSARSLAAGEPAQIEPVTPIHGKITKVVRFLNDHYAEPLSLTGVAEHFSMSPYYLSRIFKSTTGFAFSEYINLVRLKEAQRLLRETDDSVTEIAWRSGFENFSHFGKAFKKMAGVSPRAYRNLQ